MGMADVNRAFSKGLGAKGTCSGGSMTYERDEAGRRSLNRLTFTVKTPDGRTFPVSDVFSASDDPVSKAMAMGLAFTSEGT